MTTRNAGVITAAALGILAAAPPTMAQEVTQGEGGPKVACLRGRPLPECRSFWIIEMQGHSPLAQTERDVIYGGGQPVRIQTFENELEWNLGHMVNLTDHFAVGGVLAAGTAGRDGFAGLKLRMRQWIVDDVSIEAQGGLLRTNIQYPSLTGITADVRLNIRDQGSFFVRWDGVDVPPESYPDGVYHDFGGFQQAVSVGVGLGSVPALVGTGGLGLGYVILLGIFLAGDSS